MGKLVLNDDRKVSVSEEELRHMGYVKIGDNEQVVKKVGLSEDETKFMENNKHLPFAHSKKDDFRFVLREYVENQEYATYADPIYRLVRAYFNGYYTVKE